MKTYKVMIITFVDLLGFGELVDSGVPAPQILEALGFLRRNAMNDPGLSRMLGLKTMQLSDSAVRGISVKKNEGTPLLQWELLQLVHLQSELMMKGILVRGGIAMGSAYMRKDLIFGPAYQRAYALESREAKFPRIIIDNLLVEQFREKSVALGGHNSEDAWKQLRSLIRQDDDGWWFVDYLRAFESEVNRPTDFYGRFLPKHHDLILEGLAKYKDNKGVLQKYQWLGRYHNQFVNGIPKKVPLASKTQAADIRIVPESLIQVDG